MKKKTIVIGIIMILLITALIPSIGVASKKIGNKGDNIPVEGTENPIIVGFIPTKKGTCYISGSIENEEDFDESLERIEANMKANQGKLETILQQVDIYKHAVGGGTAALKNNIKNSIQTYIEATGILNDENIQLTDENGNPIEIDYEAITDTLINVKGTAGLFPGRTLTFFGAIATGGYAEKTKVWTLKGMISPEIFQGVSFFPIHTVYIWGATGIYHPALKIKTESGDHILKTWGFLGFYIAIGRDKQWNYVEGITICMGGFVFNKMINQM